MYRCENILKCGGAGAGSLLDKEAQMATILTKINMWKSVSRLIIGKLRGYWVREPCSAYGGYNLIILINSSRVSGCCGA